MRSNNVRYTCTVLQHTHWNGTCRVPPGAGSGLQAFVETPESVPDSPLVYTDDSLAPTFSYDAPHVINVTLVDPEPGRRTVGGFDIVIGGTSLSLEATVTISGTTCDISDSARSHNFIRCKVHANYGLGHPLVVTAAGQSSDAFPFDYSDPVVESVYPSGTYMFDAMNGTAIVITGYNFGLSADATAHGKVLVGSTECGNLYFVGDTVIHCVLPGGQVVGDADVIVYTWNTLLHSVNESTYWQHSDPYPVFLECPERSYGRVGEACRPCPPEAFCAGGVTDPAARSGFFMVDRNTYLACVPSEACA